MKLILPTIVFLFFGFACKQKQPEIQPPSIANEKFDCFKTGDTAVPKNRQQGCGDAYLFKQINNELVLAIHFSVLEQFDSCVTINIDSSNCKKWTKLCIYKQDEANLRTFCNDAPSNMDKYPIRELDKCNGSLSIKFFKGENNRGASKTVSMLVHHLTFTDSTSNKKYEINNELIWKENPFWFPG